MPSAQKQPIPFEKLILSMPRSHQFLQYKEFIFHSRYHGLLRATVVRWRRTLFVHRSNDGLRVGFIFLLEGSLHLIWKRKTFVQWYVTASYELLISSLIHEYMTIHLSQEKCMNNQHTPIFFLELQKFNIKNWKDLLNFVAFGNTSIVWLTVFYMPFFIIDIFLTHFIHKWRPCPCHFPSINMSGLAPSYFFL